MLHVAIRRHLVPGLILVAACTGLLTFAARAATPVIDPAKVAQLTRLEPLTPDKVDVFVEAGQLTPEQAAYVKRYIGPGGKLTLPADAVAVEPRRMPPAPAPATPAVGTNPYAAFHYRLTVADSERLTTVLSNFRYGNRAEVGRQLREFRPAVNQLVVAAYTEPIDLPIKIALWREVAGPVNPDAAIGLFETHRVAYEMAQRLLVPFAKDIGYVGVSRSRPDASAPTMQRFFTSRQLRDMILDIEGLIAECPSPAAAIFLMGVYSQRYTEGEAPMRDDGRDWRRLVEVCGGNPKKFDNDDSKTWGSTLAPRQRALIAEHLIPWLSREKGDRRRIARNALLVCLPPDHPDWDAGGAEWDQWWVANRDRLLAM